MGAVGLDGGADADVFKINANARKLRSRKHFGNASSHFLEATAAKRNEHHKVLTASKNIGYTNNNVSASHGHNANPSQSKSLRRVFT